MSRREDDADTVVTDESAKASITPAEIIDLERSQIGHDLHDTLLPLIFAASANLQSVIDSAGNGDQPQAVEMSWYQTNSARIETANQWLQQAMTIGRNLLTQIYPPELDKLSWLVAAKDTANRICGDNCEVNWTVASDSPVCDPSWDRNVATAAYRVLIEALRNAVSHGKADAISVRCSSDCIMIVDDGDGFDPAAVDPSRFGIRSMKGRALLVGKKVTIASEPGGPTNVTMTL
ncbi:MAG: hypothetical protein KDB00_19150 [Planctomycetales bacterium]|nr:hypothetical protein [Planctomycetales bacterium]